MLMGIVFVLCVFLLFAQDLADKMAFCMSKLYSKRNGCTGGTLDAVCPHRVSYGTKLLMLSERQQVAVLMAIN